jgi:hypothetical protein
VTTSWLHSILGLVAVVIALMGNILGKPELLTYFFVYFLIVGLLVLIMFQRVRIMRLLFKLLKPRHHQLQKQHSVEQETDESVPLAPFGRKDLEVVYGDEEDLIPSSRAPVVRTTTNCLKALSRAVQEVQDVQYVFFCKHDDLYMLNKAMLYIQKNEQTNKIIVVHCKGGPDHSNGGDGASSTTSGQLDYNSLTKHVKLIDLLYPQVKISLLYVSADFSPVTVEWLSQAVRVPINAMFISCPDKNFTMKVSQLRGMRIIFSHD